MNSTLRHVFGRLGAELRALVAAMPIVILAKAALEALQTNRDGGAAVRASAIDWPRATSIASPRAIPQGR
jgi:hypothetical protein